MGRIRNWLLDCLYCIFLAHPNPGSKAAISSNLKGGIFVGPQMLRNSWPKQRSHRLPGLTCRPMLGFSPKFLETTGCLGLKEPVDLRLRLWRGVREEFGVGSGRGHLGRWPKACKKSDKRACSSGVNQKKRAGHNWLRQSSSTAGCPRRADQPARCASVAFYANLKRP